MHIHFLKTNIFQISNVTITKIINSPTVSNKQRSLTCRSCALAPMLQPGKTDGIFTMAWKSTVLGFIMPAGEVHSTQGFSLQIFCHLPSRANISKVSTNSGCIRDQPSQAGYLQNELHQKSAAPFEKGWPRYLNLECLV